MAAESIFEKAVESLNKLYFSRTGKSYAVVACGNSEEERLGVLKQRIFEEKISPIFMPALLVRVAKKKGKCISIFVARRCAALLLYEQASPLKPKIDEEWEKIYSNHPHVLGDTQLIQNALYFNAEVLTRDEGAKKMAGYCGLKWVNF